MAQRLESFAIPELKWDDCDPSQFVLHYDRKTDRLYFSLPTPRPAMSLDIDEEIWVRYNPDSGEIVGLEIEDFKRVFLKKNPELELSWAQIEHQLRRSWATINRKRNNERLAAAAAIILEHIRRILVGDGPRPGLLPSASVSS